MSLARSIDASDVFKLFNVPDEFKYLTQDTKGIYCWTKKPKFYSSPKYNEQWLLAAGDSMHITSRPLVIIEFYNRPVVKCIYRRNSSPREWVGKLCKFSTDNSSSFVMGILTKYDQDARFPFQCGHAQTNFQDCKPVSKHDIKFIDDEED